MNIKSLMETAGNYSLKKRPTITHYCVTGEIPAVRHEDGTWEVDDEYVSRILSWRKHYVDLDTLYSSVPAYCSLSEKEKKLCHRSVYRLIKNEIINDSKDGLIFSGLLIPIQKQSHVEQIIKEIAESYINCKTLLPVEVAAQKVGLSVYQLKKMISAGKMDACKTQKGIYIPEAAIDNYKSAQSDLIGIYDLGKSILTEFELTLFDIEDPACRRAMTMYVQHSEYRDYCIFWELTGLHGDRRNSLYFPRRVETEIRQLLIKYFKQYGNAENRLALLKSSPYWNTHPRTKEALESFITMKVPHGVAALYEAIIYSLVPEIMDATNDEVEQLLTYAGKLSALCSKYVVQFICYCQDVYPCKADISLHYDYQASNSARNIINVDPYPTDMYMCASHMCFDDGYIKEHQLVEKALNNRTYAVLWLRMIWSFAAAWRDSDLANLMIIQLLHPKSTVKEMILAGTYKDEAIEVSLLLEKEINSRYRRPHKTQAYQDSHFLSVVFAETLRDIYGLVYSIVCIHTDQETVGNFHLTLKDYTGFFGDDYQRIFGSSTYMNRRANKSFLNKVVEATETANGTQNRVLGYMIASYTRAHSSSFGELAKTTSAYLETKMDGLDANGVLMQLWDTGALSFIPYMLFQIAYGDDFETLRIQDQTIILKESGLNAFAAETASQLITNVYYRSQNVLDALFTGTPEDAKKTMANQLLMEIVNHRALGKQPGVPCLLAAMKYPCKYSQREDCFGCKNAIYQRSLLFYAKDRIAAMYSSLAEAKTIGEQKRIRAMLEEEYLPVYFEMLEFSKFYGMDITKHKEEILQMMKGGMRRVSIHDEK